MHDYHGRQNAFYTPLSALDGTLPDLPFSKFLILKSSEDDSAGFKAEHMPQERRTMVKKTLRNSLENGLYVFKSVGIYEAALVVGARPELDTEFSKDLNTSMPDQTSPLEIARDWIEENWHDAQTQSGAISFKENTWAVVVAENVFGMVMEVTDTVEGPDIQLEVDGTRRHFRPSALRQIAGDPRHPKTWLKQTPADYKSLTNVFTWAKLKHSLSDTLYSFAATRTIFKPYQFLPAMKILNSERGRLLVADEVGLGKTIEAGLIWTELDQRHDFKRVLIVAPASLSIKWKQEMRRRFMRDISIWKLNDLDDFLDRYEESAETKCAAVISLESFRTAKKQQDRLRTLSVDFDLVILDEAHSVRNRNRKGFDLADLLADLSEYLVFLSATPLNLGKDDFFNLMNLLEPNLYPDKQVFVDQIQPNKYLNETLRLFRANDIEGARRALSVVPTLLYGENIVSRPTYRELFELLHSVEVSDAVTRSKVRDLCLALNTISSTFTRTRKKEVPGKQATRVPREIEVTWTRGEREFYEAVQEHFYQKALQSGRPPAFLMQMPLRQTCSSIPVMQASLRGKGLHELANITDYTIAEDLPEIDEFENVENWRELAEVIPANLASISVPTDSKLEALKVELRKLKDIDANQALIFTFFRGTVEYLATQLSGEYRVGALHGGYKPEEREQIIQQFRDGQFDLLIANQVGSEGLDFQFCNVLVNYDLPWNPMQVEQRIGRLDRVGQKSDKIHIFNMKVPDTIESDIYLRLYNRIDIFKESVGDLEPILQDAMGEVNKALFNPKLSPEERADQLEHQAEALENERKTLERLEDEAGLLISNAVEIEGMDAGMPSRGKYVGEGELISLVDNLLMQFGGELRPVASEAGLFWLIGSVRLAEKVSLLPSSDAGTSLGSLLPQRLRDLTPICVTFNSQNLEDSKHPDAEIISARHPLARLAISLENDSTLLPKRFGRCGFRLEGYEGKYLADVQLVKSDGVVPKSELWVTAIDLDTGERCEAVENTLLENIASGQLHETSGSYPKLDTAREMLAQKVVSRRIAEEDKRKQENASLIKSRRQSALQINDRQRKSHQDALDEKKGISQIHEAGIRKAQADRLKIEARFEMASNLTVSSQAVAIALIEVF
jgi:superfamily II DNA or RNA helicase